MTTAYEAYQLPIERSNARAARKHWPQREAHSWDGEIARLMAQDEAEQGLQITLQRQGWHGPAIWFMPDRWHRRLFDLLEETQSYREAVRRFMEDLDGSLGL